MFATVLQTSFMTSYMLCNTACVQLVLGAIEILKQRYDMRKILQYNYYHDIL